MAMHFVSRAMPINDINSKSYNTKLKSSRNYLTNHLKLKSRHYLFMALGAYTHTRTYTRRRKCFQETRRALAAGRRRPGLKILCSVLSIITRWSSLKIYLRKGLILKNFALTNSPNMHTCICRCSISTSYLCYLCTKLYLKITTSQALIARDIRNCLASFIFCFVHIFLVILSI